MGASGWAYYVPYEEDLNKALQQLRQDVFLSGNYFLWQTKSEKIEFCKSELAWLADVESKSDSEEALEIECREILERLLSLPEPTTIDEQINEIIELSAENGTHSILDIFSVSLEADFCCAAPLSNDELFSILGTDKPTKAMVENQKVKLMDLRYRWYATYVIIYEDGKPKEILFTGFSGD